MRSRSEASVRPLESSERLEFLDVLRGFALLGILIVNYADVESGRVLPRLDEIVGSGIGWLAEDSFYPLFSFLFGLGFGMQWLRTKERGLNPVLFYVRRLSALLVIGTIHAVFIWHRDILVDYSLMGFVLILLSPFPTRALLVVALVLFGFEVAGDRVEDAVSGWFVSPEHLEGRALVEAARDESFLAASSLRATPPGIVAYGQAVETRWAHLGVRMLDRASLLRVLQDDYLLMFVLGLWAARQQVFRDVAAHRARFLLVFAAGLAATLTGAAYKFTGVSWSPEADTVMWSAANKGLTVTYIAAVALLTSGRLAQALMMFAPAGQMALTNYLMQSIVMTGLIVGYAFHLPETGTTAVLLWCLAFFFLIQMPGSRWWLHRYRFGPAEWLWRSLTYGVRQPMRQPGPITLSPTQAG